MIPCAFEYFAPKTLDEAVYLLDKYEDSKIIAGGQSLVPLMKLRLITPRYLIDIGRIPGLSYIREDGENIVIGAMTTHYEVESSTLLKTKCPLLPEAASLIGDVHVRNRGTIGGSLCHLDPAADYPPVILALRGKLKAAGRDGERIIDAQDFFVDMFTTSLKRNEILTEIRIPKLVKRTGWAYLKISFRAGHFAIVNVATLVTLDEEGRCKDVSIVLGGVGSRPMRAKVVEERLLGRVVDEHLIKEASEYATDENEVLSDFHASAEYRREVSKVLTRRALNLALQRVGEGR